MFAQQIRQAAGQLLYYVPYQPVALLIFLQFLVIIYEQIM
jgi:hypothetical protein